MDPVKSIWLIPASQQSYNRPGAYRAYATKHHARTQAKKIGAQVLRIDLRINSDPTIEWESID